MTCVKYAVFFGISGQWRGNVSLLSQVPLSSNIIGYISAEMTPIYIKIKLMARCGCYLYSEHPHALSPILLKKTR